MILSRPYAPQVLNSMAEDSWIRNASGIYAPPTTEAKHVEKAVFAVKVVGFVPQDKEPRPTEGGLRSGAGTAKPGEPG